MLTPAQIDDRIEDILYRTVDPTIKLAGKPVPALTTLLVSVCGNNSTKFADATRLLELFIREALT